MIHDTHGCACCHASLGALFGYDSADERSAEISVLPIARGGNAGAAARTERVVQTACGTAYTVSQPENHVQNLAVRIYTGGTIMSVDKDFSKPEAIAISGDRILAVGTKERVRQLVGEDAETIDLDGRTLMPGFIDPHTHILIGALMDQSMEYVGTARFSTTVEVIDHIKKLDAERPDGEWIVCRNFIRCCNHLRHRSGLTF